MDPHHATQSPSPSPAARRTRHAEDAVSNNMNLTFISIHDLSPEARILYSSESVIDVLGYTPDEIVNRSVWDFFPQEEVPYAKEYHKHGIEMDKAAMLAYCRVRDRQGTWVGCECCFTIVYDVMVVCTSVYRSGLPSQKRAAEAPLIRRIFSSSPRDPRYHMLSHISRKFQAPAKVSAHEPRAALFLNRFTRTLTIMYATSGIEDILGIPSHSLQGKSFYYCIAENCLPDAIRCLEQAKGNDSIAYLRFRYRDPRLQDRPRDHPTSDDSDEEMTTTDTSLDSDLHGGVQLSLRSEDSSHDSTTAFQSDSSMDVDQPSGDEPQSRTSSGDSAPRADTHEAIFGQARHSSSSASSAPPGSPTTPRSASRDPDTAIELEAVISCASDGLVVCLRRARPMPPLPNQRAVRRSYANGLFAAPWADEPILPSLDRRPQFADATPFAPALSPQGARGRANNSPGGPARDDFMAAIREQAIFAWALTGINGSLHRFGTGVPMGESLPTNGLPVWQSDKSYISDLPAERSNPTTHGSDTSSSSTVNGNPKPLPAQLGVAVGNDHRNIFGDPGLGHARNPSANLAGKSSYVDARNDLDRDRTGTGMPGASCSADESGNNAAAAVLPDGIPGGFPE